MLEKEIIELKEVLPLVAETVPQESKKAVFAYRVLPILAIVVSVFFSLSPLFFDSGNVFKRFLAAEAVDEMRFAIEAHKFEHGAYPETIGMISRKPDPWGKPYLYRHNDYTFVVLSTGADGEEGTSDDIY
jgi:hypothetical protein